MWDYARMAQIANRLGGPAKAAVVLIGAGIAIGAAANEAIHQVQQMQKESRRKAEAEMARQAQQELERMQP